MNTSKICQKITPPTPVVRAILMPGVVLLSILTVDYFNNTIYRDAKSLANNQVTLVRGFSVIIRQFWFLKRSPENINFTFNR